MCCNNGIDLGCSPVRNIKGVKTPKSFGSSEAGTKGREFMIASISQHSVAKSSKVNRALPTTFLMWDLAHLTAASQRPPKLGEPGGMKTHSKPNFSVQAAIFPPCLSSRLRSFMSSFLVPVKVLAPQLRNA